MSFRNFKMQNIFVIHCHFQTFHLELFLENEHLNNCGQFHAVRDISIRPITVNEIEGVDGEEKGPLRTLKCRASEILGITDQ